jgi:hypothetical protein
MEDVQNLVTALMEANCSVWTDWLWFAVTGHPLTQDGHATLWLSRLSAEWLLTMEYVGAVSEYERLKY